ncbi:hypothetical protein [Pseudarthrobacter sp. MEB009]|uniref:hypothetical protein n=1 Tax=Pseudarthrobacter sp. MEB009 TaxID=3040326 RepID=UPI0025571EC2|nr:hypothetical protein [Pseudarthrobacter sp. MEB009]
MNRTNRALNRLLLALAGILLAAVGILTAGAALNPLVRDGWTRFTGAAVDRWQAIQASAPLQDPLGSWWTVALVAALVLLAVLCIVWMTRQGGGRSRTGAEDSDAELGNTAVDISYLEAALDAALAGSNSIVGSSVTAWRGSGRGPSGLRLILQTRRGASPRDVADTAEALVRSIDGLLGHHTTVLVRIATGTRTKLTGALRTD